MLDLRAARAARTAAEEEGSGGRSETLVCPYKGLARYEVEDAEFFVGRERLTASLVARLAEADVIAVIGPSGSGKSSAVRAGLLAALADGVLAGSALWSQVTLVPGGDPSAALHAALAGAEGTEPLVVFVDQLEEIFTACGDEAHRRAFVEHLLALVGGGRRTRLVVALRADFYGRCASYPELAVALADNHVLVGPLTDDELARVATLPAQRAGLTLESGLPETVVADVAGQSGALPLLSTALLGTWEHRQGATLTLGSFQAAGGISRAVERLGESAYARLDPPAAVAARRLLLRLADARLGVEADGGSGGETFVRRRAPLSEVVPEGDAAAGRALAALVERRLVTVDEITVEVAHEALFGAWPRLRAWLEDDATGRRLVRHLAAAAADWRADTGDTGLLYRGTRLQAALDWAALHGDDLTVTEREFLSASAAEGDRLRREAEERLIAERTGRRRLLRLVTALAAVLVLAVGAAAFAADQRGDARDAARVAEARRLGALGVVTQDLDRALLLAVQATRIEDSAETRGDLLATLLRSPAAAAVVRPEGGHRLLGIDVSPDGRLVVLGDNVGHILMVDTTTREVEVLAEPPGKNSTILVVALSPDGRTVAAVRSVDNSSFIELWDLPTRTQRRLAGSEGAVGIGWSPDGRRLVLPARDFDTVVVDVADRSRRVTLGGSRPGAVGGRQPDRVGTA